MAIVDFCGYETGNDLEMSNAAGTFSVQSTVKRTGTFALQCNPVTTATGYGQQAGLTATGRQTASYDLAIWYVTFYFRYATKPSANDEIMAYFFTGVSNNFEIRINSTGNLLLYYNASTLLDTGTATLAANTWYRIEVAIDTTADTQEVKVDGTSDMTAAQATAVNLSTVVLGKFANRNGNTVDFFYDDYCIDSATWVGVGECRLSIPIGAGAAAGWTAGTNADDFNEVDDVAHDTDTTYIGALATEDNQDHTFAMQTFSTIGGSGSIGAVKTMTVSRSDSTAGTSAVAQRRLFNGSGFELTALEAPTTYVLLAKVDVTDPSAGGGAITVADFDSIEVGMAANTIAQVQRFTAAYAAIWVTGVQAVVTGTATAGITEADIVAGGKTIIITLSNDTWIAAGAGSFDLQRDEIIAGLDSAQSEALGWDLQVKALQSLGGVVRTSDTVVTVTLDASALYNITATETITVTVPSTALLGGVANVVATPTFTVIQAGGAATYPGWYGQRGGWF